MTPPFLKENAHVQQLAVNEVIKNNNQQSKMVTVGLANSDDHTPVCCAMCSS